MADTMRTGADRSPSRPHLVDIEYVARYLGVTVRHVRRLVAERRIPFIKWGRLLRFDMAEIVEWVNGWRRPEGS